MLGDSCRIKGLGKTPYIQTHRHYLLEQHSDNFCLPVQIIKLVTVGSSYY
jgi:hypothetical protein